VARAVASERADARADVDVRLPLAVAGAR
jgi:hypothetical protein